MSFVICVCESSGNTAFCSFFFFQTDHQVSVQRVKNIMVGGSYGGNPDTIYTRISPVMHNALGVVRCSRARTTKQNTHQTIKLSWDELRSYKPNPRSKTHLFDVRRIEQFCEKVHALGRYRIQDQFRRRCAFCRLGHEHKRLQFCS